MENMCWALGCSKQPGEHREFNSTAPQVCLVSLMSMPAQKDQTSANLSRLHSLQHDCVPIYTSSRATWPLPVFHAQSNFESAQVQAEEQNEEVTHRNLSHMRHFHGEATQEWCCLPGVLVQSGCFIHRRLYLCQVWVVSEYYYK